MKKFSFLAVFAMALVACDGSHRCEFDEQEQVLRCPERNYRTVSILGKNWFAENARFFTDFSYCYDNDFKMCDNYGRFYTWESSKKACPEGWRVPTRAEFEELLQYGEFEKLGLVHADFATMKTSMSIRERAIASGLVTNMTAPAYMVNADGENVLTEHLNKSIAASIRCVQE